MSEGERYKEKKVTISESDLSGIDDRLAKSEGLYSKRDLLRFQLPRFLKRVEEGRYDPVDVLNTVGSPRSEDRTVFGFSPKGESGWDRIEKAAQTINEDVDIAEVNAVEDGTIFAWPYRRPCKWQTVLRAAAHELAEGAPIFSEDMVFVAEKLRAVNTDKG